MSIPSAARRVARLLQARDQKVVFAESCTGGLVSGALTAIPGISNYHCGGMVVYRNATKRAYLNVPPRLIKDPGPVSPAMTEMLARRVLEKTPEADLAVAVTGHLGPGAPAALDGRAFVAIARRRRRPTANGSKQARAKYVSLTMHEVDCREQPSRTRRQRAVVEQVLHLLGRALEDEGNRETP